jgi:chemotaxis protein CheD
MAFPQAISTPVAKKMIVVSVADFVVSRERNVHLSTYGVGSSIGVVIFDSKNLIGGMLHCMLPDSRADADRAKKRPGMFADTGVRLLVSEFKNAGGELEYTKVLIAGGGGVMCTSNFFNVGDRNVKAVLGALKEHGITSVIDDLGGVNNRTLSFEVGTGDVIIKTACGSKTLSLQ